MTSPRATSFVQRAAKYGVNSLVQKYYPCREGYFDQCMRGLKIDNIDQAKGTVLCSLKVNQELENAFATLHGGAIASVVDICGTLALLSKDQNKPGVSVELNVSFCSAAPAGSSIEIEGKVVKYGKSLAFTQIDMYDKISRRQIATGRHTKYFINYDHDSL